ncbi:serine/threonine protein kinase [Nonomuraea soli]|uniref:non-specific serine/threonine protein kinase n=1 Tax=Nonomuraea soli TaxID=1032476 RepID=A0A7W0HNE2_9ACTN|nr:serine/threonine-protein kinase [Nonomuraea soli]MBA2889704.1 serine/threonine protein kinase [Nonomuraea soli]
MLRPIGRGGMGKVWHAHDEVLDRDVAVKEVFPPADLTEEDREAFTRRTFREARAAGRVSHPGVAAVYDVLEEGGHPWIVMQLVPSDTLGSLAPLPPRRVAEIGLQVLAALRAAHAAGVLHRDVKPDNVLLTEGGRAVLTDFGIATTPDDVTVTRTGVLVGTPAFIAPERAMGSDATPASDLWSLGVTLYHAVEGCSPFQRDNPLATLGAVIHAQPAPMARAGALAPVITGLLRKHPDERMTMEETEQRLAAIVTGAPAGPTGPVPPPPDSGPGPRRRVLAVAAAALAVALVAGGAAWFTNRGAAGERPSAPPAASSSVSRTDDGVRQGTPSQPSDTPSGATPERLGSSNPSGTPTRGSKPSKTPASPSGKPTGKPSDKPSGKPSKADEPEDNDDGPGRVEPSSVEGDDEG